MFSSFFRKGGEAEVGNLKVVKRPIETLLQKLTAGDSDAAIGLLEDPDRDAETRAKMIAYCEALANAGLKPARRALTVALQRSPTFREKEQAALPHIKMAAVQEGGTAAALCESVRCTMPSQVFVTGGGIFNEVISAQKEIEEALGAQYNIRLLNANSRALARHALITLKREIQAAPCKRNLVIGIYPTVSWSYFLPFPPSAYDLFSPWLQRECNAAVFLIGPLSYAYVIEAASLINGENKASGFFENLVSTGNPRLTNQEYEQLQSATSPAAQSEVLWQCSKNILKSYEQMGSSGMAYSGPPEALEVVRHEAFAEMYLSREMYEEAISELETAVALERDRRILADHYVNLALCHAQLGRSAQATALLRKISEIPPALAAEAQQIIESLQD